MDTKLCLCWTILIGILVLLLTGTSAHESRGYTAVCESYCDMYGYYRPSQICWSSSRAVYCCGSEHIRYCCNDEDLNVGTNYPSVSTCPRSSWWLYHWRMIISLMGTLMALILCGSCCYYCCVSLIKDKRSPVARLRNRGRDPSEENVPQVEQPTPPTVTVFNPDSPFAFSPPEYETLPREPPKYSDICSQDGLANPAFTLGTNENLNMNNEPNECEDASGISPEGAVGGVSPGGSQSGQVYVMSVLPEEPPPAYEPLVHGQHTDTTGDVPNLDTSGNQSNGNTSTQERH